MLNNRLQFELALPGAPEGERKTLSRAEVMSYVFSSQAELRAAAYRELGRVYEREAAVLGQIYISLMRDWHWEKVELRGYPQRSRRATSPTTCRTRRSTSSSRWCARTSPSSTAYFRLKARWLGVERLHRNDLYAPLATVDRQIPYGDAVATVLDTFARFSPVFAATPSGLRRGPRRQPAQTRGSGAATSARRSSPGSPPGCWSTTPAGRATS